MRKFKYDEDKCLITLRLKTLSLNDDSFFFVFKDRTMNITLFSHFIALKRHTLLETTYLENLIIVPTLHTITLLMIVFVTISK